MIQKENELGSIKPGKIADFTILEQDPFAIPIDQLKNIAVWSLVYEGRKVEASKERASTARESTISFTPDAPDLTELSKTRG